MKHPKSRAERRHERKRIVNYRRFIRINGSAMEWPEQTWGQYAKWNGDCGSPRCHSGKYFGFKRKRREALKCSVRDELKDVGL